MFLNLLFLAFTLSIDSFGIGISYGIQNIKILNSSKMLLFVISFIVVFLSTFVGFAIKQFFPVFQVQIIR